MIIQKIRRIIANRLDTLKKNSCFYYTVSLKKSILQNTILLEAGQGMNINGNMFALLRELQTNEQWKHMETVFVVTKDNYQKASARMDFYNFQNVVLVERLSKKYNKYLSRAKYIATDNSFPPYFHKRKDQIYLNTWHGTPLKTLGKSDKSSLLSYANIQKNYLMSDYALFPNRFTMNVFADDYYLRHLFQNKIMLCNYPRNEVFYDDSDNAALKEKLGLSHKEIFAYMPTWRGAQRSADVKQQVAIIEKQLQEIDMQLQDNQVFFVNLHFLVGSSIDYSRFSHIFPFPAEYETYDFLKITDALVTDYSSVFFDYAITKKKIILFAYDKESYLKNRGMYINLEDLPFPIVETPTQLIGKLNETYEIDYSDFISTYCTNGSDHISRDILSLLIEGKNNAVQTFTNPDAVSSYDLLFAGKLGLPIQEAITQHVSDNAHGFSIVSYRGNLDYDKTKFINSLPRNIIPFGTVTSIQFTFFELLYISVLYLLKKIKPTNKHLQQFFHREKSRLFPTLTPKKVVDFSSSTPILNGIVRALCKKYTRQKVSSQSDYTVKQLFPLLYNRNGYMHVLSFVTIKGHRSFSLQNISIEVNNCSYIPQFICGNTAKNKKAHHCIWKISIPIEDTFSMEKNNPVTVDFHLSKNINTEGETITYPVFYNKIFRNFTIASKGPVWIDKKKNFTACFRQAQGNKLSLMVRNTNTTDFLKDRIQLVIAFLLSPFFNRKKIIFLFEKEGSRYEESASVLYEKLIDAGYSNAFFLLDKKYPFIKDIDKKYRGNILYKGTFKHYLYFFASKTFIGSEAVAHALDISTLSKVALQKITSNNYNYVFLQHGVMYMVSLDSPSRTFFKKAVRNKKYKYRVIVSSEAEANHFILQGEHEGNEVYITGLPKFDKNKWNKDADKIAIMPTWRPWEANEVQANPTECNYYKMMMRIADSIPAKYQDKIILLPHPLFQKRIAESNSPMKERFLIDEKYDTILQQTALLITDYSSIAYDAFYRGAQVIFYWEEKDHCMECYGPGTKLMLTEENTFAPVVYNQEELTDAFLNTYRTKHSLKQDEKYKEIVSFHDGNNTKRLIKMLQEDNLI